jgi:transcriptional regulator with XRE-family HTH domain
MTRQNVRAKARGLGAELADLRAQAGMTLREVADRLGWSAPTLCRIENGTRDTTTEEVAALLVIYKITGARNDRLVELARTIDQPGWWETSASGLPGQLTALCAFEAEATKITDVSMILVPGLLQTADYARAVMEATGVPDGSTESMVAVRLGRQAILSRRLPPALHVILDEAVLRRPMGGPAVMAAQIRYLIGQAARPNITVQVLRQAEHQGLDGSYFLLEFSPPAKPFVHLEHLRSSLFLDEPDDVSAFQAVTATLAHTALDPASTRDVLARFARRYEDQAK